LHLNSYSSSDRDRSHFTDSSTDEFEAILYTITNSLYCTEL